jgi:hypothetical protein
MWLLKRIHAYAGLLTFVNLAVYGVVGLSVTFLRESEPSAPVVSYQNFSLEPNLTDRQVAQLVRSQLNLSLATLLNNAAIEDYADNNCISISTMPTAATRSPFLKIRAGFGSKRFATALGSTSMLSTDEPLRSMRRIGECNSGQIITSSPCGVC